MPLSKFDRVIDSIFHLTNHIGGPLELEILETHLNRVQSIHRLVVAGKLVRLVDREEQVWAPTHILDLFKKLKALFHDGLVDLDATLLR